MLDGDDNCSKEDELDQPKKKEKEEKDEDSSIKLGYNQFMIEDTWKVGGERLINDNVKKSRNDTFVRAEEKCKTSQAIVNKVNNKKASTSVLKEEMNIEMPTWTQHMMKLFPGLYQLVYQKNYLLRSS